MPRERRVDVAVVNIKTHPHTPERYVELLRTAYRSDIAAKYRGNRFGMLGSFHIMDREELAYAGQIHTFLEIDVNRPWLDTQRKDEAEDKELNTILLPRHLKPEFESFDYVFLAKRHRILFDTSGRSPNTVARLFLRMLNDERVRKELDKVDVNVEQSRDELEKLWRLPELRSLYIEITKPNGDDWREEEERLLKRLEEQHARKWVQELQEDPQVGSLAPDQETKAMARVALSNGYVYVKGKDADGVRVETSTVEHPATLEIKVPSGVRAVAEYIYAQSGALLRSILRR